MEQFIKDCVQFYNLHQEVFKNIGSVVTVLSAFFAFWNSWSAKKALLADKKQRTRTGEVELGVTYPIGSGMYRLAKLAMRPVNGLFVNREREEQFRRKGNQDVTSDVNGQPENVGLQDMGSVGENKFVSLTFQSLIAELTQQATLWAAAGVPMRYKSFLLAFRWDTYSTVDKTDGYQTGRSMLLPIEEVIAAGEDETFLDRETEIPYQKDRLHHMREVYRIWKSEVETDKWRVTQIELPVPELLYMGSEIQRLSTLVTEAQQALEELRALGGELEDNRLQELAQLAADRTVARLAQMISESNT